MCVVFHSRSNYDYHFKIKKLSREFEGHFDCLCESTERCMTFSAPIKKEIENGKSVTYKKNNQ